MIRNGEEIVAGVLVGGNGLFRQHIPVRPARMGVKHPLVPTS